MKLSRLLVRENTILERGRGCRNTRPSLAGPLTSLQPLPETRGLLASNDLDLPFEVASLLAKQLSLLKHCADLVRDLFWVGKRVLFNDVLTSQQ